jgi:CheY-like chemotaxis protein
VQLPLNAGYGVIDVTVRVESAGHWYRSTHCSRLRRPVRSPFVAAHYPAQHETFMEQARRLIAVVDDDESVRESLPDLLHEFGFATCVYASAAAFLVSDSLSKTDCLIVDLAMPEMTGEALQLELQRRQYAIPVIVISAQQDQTVRARIQANGAADYLDKPFSDTALREAIDRALGSRR